MSSEYDPTVREGYEEEIENRLMKSLRRARSLAVGMAIVGALGAGLKSRTSTAEPIAFGLLGTGVAASFFERRRALNYADNAVLDFKIETGSDGSAFGYTELSVNDGELGEDKVHDYKASQSSALAREFSQLGAASALDAGATGPVVGDLLRAGNPEEAIYLGGALCTASIVFGYFDSNFMKSTIRGYSSQLNNIEYNIRFRGPEESS